MVFLQKLKLLKLEENEGMVLFKVDLKPQPFGVFQQKYLCV